MDAVDFARRLLGKLEAEEVATARVIVEGVPDIETYRALVAKRQAFRAAQEIVRQALGGEREYLDEGP